MLLCWEVMMMIEYIQAALLIIAAFMIIVSAIGLLSLSNNTKNKVYARIHIVGIFDIACIIAMIGLGQYLLAGIYFILAPFTAHAIANAYWKKEDRENNADLMTVEEEVDENHPFIHPKEKMQALESEDSEKLKADERFSVTTIEIDEGE
ncbi:cation:proton antiporter [Methanobrevibacter thaueri]|uniref:cation:proton antiporter n=1 Tax=Methanobrevibacter thaueri TaxID=190975 RepID=UPI0026F2D6F8|nr:cation:proton antiporter [Methanobrevibacter thaueri]